MSPLRVAVGSSVAVNVPALYVTLAGTAVVPGPSRVNVEPLTPVTASLNVAVTLVPVATPVAPGAGVSPVTVGAVVSGGGGPVAPGRGPRAGRC